MKYLLTVTLTGILAASTLGFANTATPSITDLKLVNEQVNDNNVSDPTARHRGWDDRGWRWRGHRGHRGWRWRGHRGFFFFGGQPDGMGNPEAMPSPQGE